MRFWAKRFGKCVRQRNVRQDNTKDRAGTLPLNLYETQTVLNPLDLSSVLPGVQGLAQFEGEETVEREQDVPCVDTVEDDDEDVYSSNDSESDGTDDDDDDQCG